MQEGTVLNLHLARVKGTPSEPVPAATAISAQGLEGDRSCRVGNPRQVLVMDQETLDHFQLAPGQVKENITTVGIDLAQAQPGQVFFVGDAVTLEVVGECEPCGKMDAIRMGLRQELRHRRGILTMVISGGPIQVGDPIRLEP